MATSNERSPRHRWVRARARSAASALLLSLITALGACSALDDPSMDETTDDVEIVRGADPAAPTPAKPVAGQPRAAETETRPDATKDPAGAKDEPAPAGPAAERMPGHSGQVWVEVQRPAEVMAGLLKQVTALGGRLQQQFDHTVVVQVPIAKFDEAYAWIRGSGRVVAETRQIEDANGEAADLGIRIDTARKSRERLLEILKKADKVEDLLKVEVELRRLTEEVDRMEARQKLVADRTTMATLEATFQVWTEDPAAKTARKPSRFAWINSIGAERVMEDF